VLLATKLDPITILGNLAKLGVSAQNFPDEAAKHVAASIAAAARMSTATRGDSVPAFGRQMETDEGDLQPMSLCAQPMSLRAGDMGGKEGDDYMCADGYMDEDDWVEPYPERGSCGFDWNEMVRASPCSRVCCIWSQRQ
jgi:hypothetical protein